MCYCTDMDAPSQPQTERPLLARVGIIGDVHAQDRALASALAFLHALPEPLDALLCSGDLVSGDGDANEAIHLLRHSNVITVRGNHDRWFGHDYYHNLSNFTALDTVQQENREYVFGLPPTQTLSTVSGSLLLCHGVGEDDMAGLYRGAPDEEIAWKLQRKHLDRFRFIVAGHTHARMVRPILNTDDTLTTIINAGTFLPDQTPGFLVCDFVRESATAYHLSPASDFSVSEGRTAGLRFTIPLKD